jgi:hypothetical protein
MAAGVLVLRLTVSPKTTRALRLSNQLSCISRSRLRGQMATLRSQRVPTCSKGIGGRCVMVMWFDT